ncbi:hypothetical protein ACS0TY_004616 [Phlomoides rotata]
MLSSAGLEVMNSTNPELNWKIVTKGRRSRKSVARSLNGGVKVGKSISPKRVGDFSGSDCDKFGELILGQSTSGKSGSVPPKKRRHLLQSPPPHPRATPLRGQDSASKRTCSSSPFSEDHDLLQYPSCSLGQRSSNWNKRRVQGSAKVGGGFEFGDVSLCKQTVSGYIDTGDFSGIELLAAAASMDADADKANEKDHQEDSSMPNNSDSSSSATLSNVGLKNNESENSSSNANVHGGDMDCSQEKNSASASKSHCASPEDGTVPKVNRQHWDLNTLMDAWEEPYDDSSAGDTINDMHMEGKQKVSRDHPVSDPHGTKDESSDLKLDKSKSASVSEEIICSEPFNVEEHLQEPSMSIYSLGVAKTPDQAGEKDPDDSSSIQVLNYGADVKKLNEISSPDAILDSSTVTKLCLSSGMLLSEENTNSISRTVAIIQEEDCSSNVIECERSTVPGGIDRRAQDVNAHEIIASETVIDVQHKDTQELPGMFTRDAQPASITDLKIQNDPVELDAKHEDSNHLNEGLKGYIMDETFRSRRAGAQCEDLTASSGRNGFSIDGQHDSAISLDNRVHLVDGDDFTGFQEGYDSPYEDGELRGSILYSWEDNEIECVDYESDGRNGDGSDAADYPASEIVEGGSEASQGTQRSLSVKISPEGKSKSAQQLKQSLRNHFVKDNSDNNEVARKESNAGSGTTVEQCMEMLMVEDDGTKIRRLINRREAVDVKVTDINEYASKMASRGKLQSRIEGRSSANAAEGKEVYFMQGFRPRRIGGPYSRMERDVSPDRYMNRYRSNTQGERDGVHHWTSWDSRRRYNTSNYQGAEGRNHTRPTRSKIVESAVGPDFHDSRQTGNYTSRGLHRPLMRRSPVERDEYFVSRRMPPITRGVANYRSRGHYSQRGGRGGGNRDFVEDFEPLPDDAGPSVRYFSRRERSFSPAAGRGVPHITLPRRSSRSRSREWHPNRERILGGSRRRCSRSPEFRPEARMERMRLPFSKPSFIESDYVDDYMSPPPRGRFSPPQQNCRWVDERNFAERRRRSPPPVRAFRRPQRFDAGRVKSDEYFRPVARSGRFSFMGNGGRECKLESVYEDRRREEDGEMMHQALHCDDGGNVRRFRNNGSDNFEMNKLNNEDDVRATEPLAQGEREDKSAFNV